MRAQCYCIAAFWISLFGVSAALGADTRTYSFVGDTPAYQFSCDCLQVNAFRAQVTGTFTVSLDVDHGNGTLLGLDAHLVNYEGYEDGQWHPFPAATSSVGTGGSTDPFQPPFVGALTSADYRPLGPNTWTPSMLAPYDGEFMLQIPPSISFWTFMGVGFEPAPAGSWMLTGNWTRSFSDPVSSRSSVFPNFIVYMQGNDAYFGFYVPTQDATPFFAAAHAVLVPEPSVAALGLIALISLVNRRRWRAF